MALEAGVASDKKKAASGFSPVLAALAGRKEPVVSFLVILTGWQILSFILPP